MSRLARLATWVLRLAAQNDVVSVYTHIGRQDFATGIRAQNCRRRGDQSGRMADRTINPRLTAIEGPLRGQTFAIDEEKIDIGREPGNLLSIEDSSISRRHCVVHRAQDGRITVRDLNSKNGTFVNGLPISERVLEEGDEIRLGKCLFVFQILEEEPDSEGALQFDDAALDTGTLSQLRREDSLYLKPRDLLDVPAGPGGIARGLATLLHISASMHILCGRDELARQLLALTFEAVPALHGAILLFEPGSDVPAWVYVWDRDRGPGGTLQAHLPIVTRVWREGIAILGSAPATRFSDSHMPARRILAAPIRSLDKTVGIIYLESADPRVCFDGEHLQLVTAIGDISGTAVENARRLEWLEAENRRLRQEINIEHDMVGASLRMREVYEFISKVSPTDSTVLLCGESGTGKELVARAIHRNSPRAAGPFAAINCATLTDTLLESELFGHEKGAFTGAIALRKGKFEAAAGGTAFLDEVGELPLPHQAKLLRVLQEREFERVGGNRPIRSDVRVIAATNRDLDNAVAKGEFRKDLYFRLNVVPLTLPPLRDRREDIPLLAAHFAAKHGKRSRRDLPEISQEALACLLACDWPGNVRELENAIEHAIVLGSSNLILPEDLPETVLESPRAATAPIGSYQHAICDQRKRLILNALDAAGGVFTEAAKLLGVHPNYLHRLVRQLNLKAEIKKSGTAQPNG
jgi:transcriptional regulator with GAF, ATPase, and Fis domain